MVPFLSLLNREIRRFLRVIVQTIVTPLVSSCLYLFIFGVSLGDKVQINAGYTYLAFLIPGLMMMTLINNSFQNSSSSIVTSKFTGELEDLRVVPLSSQAILWALGFGAVVRGTFVATITFLVGSIFFYFQKGFVLGVAHPFELIFFMIFSGLVFGFLGLAAAFWAKSFDQLGAVNAFILLPLTYLGGVFISIEHLHPILQIFTRMNPLFYIINGARHAVIGVSDVDIGTSIAVVSFSVFVFYWVALWSLRKGSFARWS